MIRKLLIIVPVILALTVVSLFVPAQRVSIEGIGKLSFETAVTLSVGPGEAYASPDPEITYNSASSGTSGSSPLTFSHTVNSGSNKILTVGVASEFSAATASTVSGITYNGVALTQIDTQLYDSDENRADLWYLLNPDEGTYNVVVTLTSDTNLDAYHAGAITIDGAAQQAPEADNKASGAGYGSSVSLTTLTDNAWIIDIATNANSGEDQTAGTGQTERWEGPASTLRANGSTKPVTTAGATTMSWSFDYQQWAIIAASFAPAAPWLNCWAKRVKITIDSADIDEDVTHFPVLIYLSSASGRDTPKDDVTFVFDELASDANRKKIAVTKSDGTTQLYVEIEKWDATGEEAWLWVKVPSISSSADTDLYLYYDSTHADNDTYVGDTNSTPAENVWSNGYEAVYHLNNHFLDSVGNHDAADSGSDDVEGRIGRGRNIDPAPDDHIDLGNWSVSGHEFTMQLWAYYDTFQNDARSLSKAEAGSTQDHVWMLSGYGTGETRLRFRLKTGTDDGSGTTELYNSGSPELDAETWYLIACTYDGAYMRIILDGTDIANVAKTGELRENAWDIYAGTNPVTLETMDGRLDEVRISSAVRSPDWLAAEYETGRDHLLDFGSEETLAVDILNAPTSKDFGNVSESSSYWSNGSAPDWGDGLNDAECFFEVTNNSSVPVNISIRATNFVGGDTWTLVPTDPSGNDNQVRLKAGKSGDNAEGDMVTLINTDRDFISDLGTSSSIKWEIKLETGTFTDGVEKTSTITLTATCA